MRVRRNVAIIGTFAFLCACLFLYLMTDWTLPQKKPTVAQEYEDNKWLHFEDRLKRLEKDLDKHHADVGEIKQVIRQLKPPPINSISSSENNRKQYPVFNDKAGAHRNGTPISEMLYSRECPLQTEYSPNMIIQMLEMYKSLTFDNPDGGAWKQGFPIEYNDQQWNKHHKLKVFVIPHSHNDPGWIKTIEQYFSTQTRQIFENMVVKLSEDSRRKMVWAEISYLSMWWMEIDADKKRRVKNLIENGQLEIVTGGWVMTDEANSHWMSILMQLTEGHQWLEENIGVKPRSGWAIDPFGQSPTLALLWRRAGIKDMVINRVHYSVKKQLARHSQLEFKWRQLWDGNGHTEMFTHMMPFYSYDIPHTCGPDPKICCQFDFKRLPGYGLSCPWRIAPQVITDTNVAARANLLLDQYRKKSQLYKTNVLLVPLGDDFRYDHSTEWDAQFKNYQKLFDFMNENPTSNVQIQFGTVSDYFKAVHEEESSDNFPTLSGDFFTYADRDDHYWSGYYTSRPFYKRVDRVLLSYLRAAEIVITLAYGIRKQPASTWLISASSGLPHLLSEARQSLSLFQHHDGITGTARSAVVIDYGTKMLTAINSSQHVIQHAVNVLLSTSESTQEPDPDVTYYDLDDYRITQNSLPHRTVLSFGHDTTFKKIVLFNSLTSMRHEVVTFTVSTPYVKLTDARGTTVRCQISPVFENELSMSESRYEMSFVANVPALGLVTYTVSHINDQTMPSDTNLAGVIITSYDGEIFPPNAFKDSVEVRPSGSDFSLHNSRVTAAFNEMGLLKALRVGSITLPVHLDFAKYGVRPSAERSGAYLFLPDGDAQSLYIEKPIVRVIEGPVYSSVTVQLPYVHHSVILCNTPGADSLGLEIRNVVDITKTSNFELVMRLSTTINNTDEFFTDLNGFQMIRRKKFKKLPIQANYYPIPTQAYIEDTEGTRLTLLTAGPLGVSSLKRGQLEVMLDRRLMQDDNRGLGQDVTDNLPTQHIFRVLLERHTHKCQTTAANHPAGFPSLSAHVASQSLLNPIIRLIWKGIENTMPSPGYDFVSRDPGVDITLPVLRTSVLHNGNNNNIGIVVHRQHVDLCFSDRLLLKQFPLSDGKVNISSIVPSSLGSTLTESSLSFMHVGREVELRGAHSLCPMDVQAYLMHS